MAANSIIIIAGPPGVGKTTIAEKLVADPKYPTAHIEGDRFWSFIKNWDGIEVRTNFRMIIRSMIAASLPFAGVCYEVVTDFCVPPRYLDVLKKIIGEREITLHYIVLKASLETCKQRLTNREGFHIDDYSRLEKLFHSFDDEERHAIYNEGTDTETIVSNLREGIDTGAFLVRL